MLKSWLIWGSKQKPCDWKVKTLPTGSPKQLEPITVGSKVKSSLKENLKSKTTVNWFVHTSRDNALRAEIFSCSWTVLNICVLLVEE